MIAEIFWFSYLSLLLVIYESAPSLYITSVRGVAPCSHYRFLWCLADSSVTGITTWDTEIMGSSSMSGIPWLRGSASTGRGKARITWALLPCLVFVSFTGSASVSEGNRRIESWALRWLEGQGPRPYCHCCPLTYGCGQCCGQEAGVRFSKAAGQRAGIARATFSVPPGSTCSVFQSPIFRCTNAWNYLVYWCFGQRCLRWAMNALLIVDWRGKTKWVSHLSFCWLDSCVNSYISCCLIIQIWHIEYL